MQRIILCIGNAQSFASALLTTLLIQRGRDKQFKGTKVGSASTHKASGERNKRLLEKIILKQIHTYSILTSEGVVYVSLLVFYKSLSSTPQGFAKLLPLCKEVGTT